MSWHTKQLEHDCSRNRRSCEEKMSASVWTFSYISFDFGVGFRVNYKCIFPDNSLGSIEKDATRETGCFSNDTIDRKDGGTVQQAAHALGRSFVEVVRACMASDLQKFTAQERKQKRAQEMERDSV